MVAIFMKCLVMYMFVEIVTFLFGYFVWVKAVPPEACFATFRWEDCGRPPVPVLYYWKPGSRCEVGLWRGCLPNINMFEDEYECVATCIFTARAGDEDYHKVYASGETEPGYVETTASTDGNCTASGDTVTGGNVTDSGADATQITVDTKEPESNSTSSSNVAAGGTTTA